MILYTPSQVNFKMYVLVTEGHHYSHLDWCLFNKRVFNFPSRQCRCQNVWYVPCWRHFLLCCRLPTFGTTVPTRGFRPGGSVFLPLSTGKPSGSRLLTRIPHTRLVPCRIRWPMPLLVFHNARHACTLALPSTPARAATFGGNHWCSAGSADSTGRKDRGYG